VEDEEIVRQLLLGLLKEEGYSVDRVATGEEALKALDRGSTTWCCWT
jgi:CheY-like chemotaxis protein